MKSGDGLPSLFSEGTISTDEASPKRQKISAGSPATDYNRGGERKYTMPDIPLDGAFWKRMLKNIARHARGDIDPEELLNIAFLRLERYSAGHVVDNPKAFLVRTAKNALIDRYRHEQISARYAADAQQTRQDRDESPLQDEVFASRARLNRVRQGLNQLQPRTREIFLMYRLEELKCREIARRLGISESAVEKHIAKAMFFLTKWSEGW